MGADPAPWGPTVSDQAPSSSRANPGRAVWRATRYVASGAGWIAELYAIEGGAWRWSVDIEGDRRRLVPLAGRVEGWNAEKRARAAVVRRLRKRGLVP